MPCGSYWFYAYFFLKFDQKVPGKTDSRVERTKQNVAAGLFDVTKKAFQAKQLVGSSQVSLARKAGKHMAQGLLPPPDRSIDLAHDDDFENQTHVSEEVLSEAHLTGFITREGIARMPIPKVDMAMFSDADGEMEYEEHNKVFQFKLK